MPLLNNNNKNNNNNNNNNNFPVSKNALQYVKKCVKSSVLLQNI